MSVIIPVKADQGQLQADLGRIEKSLGSIDNAATKAVSSFKSMAISLGAAVASVGAYQALKGVADEYTNIGNRIKTITDNSKDFTKTSLELRKLAMDTNASVSASVDLYATLSRSLGASTDMTKTLKVTKAIQQSLAISGGNASSAAAAVYQLSQGLSSGTLRGEELNSVLEQAPGLARAISDGMGISYGQLRAVAAQGKITTEVVMKALLDKSADINKEFSKMAPTLSQAETVLGDSIKSYIGQFNQGAGITSNMASAMKNVATWISKSADNAHDLGLNFKLFYDRIVGNSMLVIRPIKQIGEAMLQLGAMAMPRFAFTHTLTGDLNESLVKFDEWSGGMLTSMNTFFNFNPDIAFATDVEKAIIRLKKALSPKIWVGSALDVHAIRRLFSRETLAEIGDSFSDLAAAMLDNSKGMSNTIDYMQTEFKRFGLSVKKYFGFSWDSIFSITPGVTNGLFKTLAEILMGITGVTTSVLDMQDVLAQYVGSGAGLLKHTVLKIIKQLPVLLFDAAKTIVSKVASVFRGGFQIVIDFIPDTSVLDTLSASLGDSFKSLDKMVSGSSFDKLKSTFSSMFSGVNINFDWVGSALDKLSSAILPSFNPLEVVKDKFEDVKDYLRDVADKIKGIFDDHTSINLFSENLFDAANSFGVAFLSIKASLFALKALLMGDIGWGAFVEAIQVTSSTLWISVKSGLETFGREVIKIFFEIWDAVIGHSWWTDTVENVIETSTNLWDNSKSGLLHFKNNVVDMFESIQKRGLSFHADKFSFSEMFSSSNFSFGKLINDAGTFANVLKEAGQGLLDSFESFMARFKGAYPQLLRMVIFGAAIGIVQAMFPEGKMKSIIRGVLISSFAGSALYFSEAMSTSVTDQSLIGDIAGTFGTAIGMAFATIPAQLPPLINAITTAFSSFARGFLEQMPLMIGSISKGLFALGDMTGTSGAMGVIGGLLFGKLGVSGFKGVMGLADGLKGILGIASEGDKDAAGKDAAGKAAKKVSMFSSVKTFVSGEGEGVLSRHLFGTLGATRSIGLIGSALDMFGSFDSLFEGSNNTHALVRGGLLASALFGDDLKNMGAEIYEKYVSPVMGKIFTNKKMIPKTKFGEFMKANVVDIFSGDGTLTEKLSMSIFSVVSSAMDIAAAKVSKWTVQGTNILSEYLFGKSPTELYKTIMDKTKVIAQKVKDGFKNSKLSTDTFLEDTNKRPSAIAQMRGKVSGTFTNLGDKMKAASDRALEKAHERQFVGPIQMSPITQPISASVDKAGISGKVSEAINWTSSKFSSFSDSLKVSQGGLMGKLISGKNFKAFAVGALGIAAMLFASVASAAEASASQTITPFSSLTDTIIHFSKEAPVAAAAIVLTFGLAVGAVFQLTAAIKNASGGFRGFMASVGSDGAWSAFTKNGLKSGGIVSKGLMGALGGGLGYIVGSQFGEGFGVMAGLAVGKLTTAFSGQIMGVLGTIGTFLMTAIITPIAVFLAPFAAVIAAIAAVALLIAGVWVAFFVEGDTFVDKLKNVWNMMFGGGALEIKDKDKKSGLYQEDASFLAQNDIKLTYNMKSLEGLELDSKAKEKLEKAQDELAKEVSKAKDDKDRWGFVKPETRKTIEDANKTVESIIDSSVSKFSKTDAEITEKIEKMGRLSEDPAYTLGYKARLEASKLFSAFNGRPSIHAKAYKEVAGDPRFDRNAMNLTPEQKQIIEFTKSQKDLDIGPLKKQLNEALRDYQKAMDKAKVVGSDGKVASWYNPDKNLGADSGRKWGFEDAADQTAAMRAETQLLMTQKLADWYVRASKEAAAFAEAQSKATSSLEGAGVNVDNKMRFSGYIDFVKFKDLAKQADILKNNKNQARTVDEYNDNLNQQDFLQAQVNALAKAGQINNGVRNQYQLAQNMEAAGVGIFTEDTYKYLSDEQSKYLNKLALEIGNAQDLIKLNPQIIRNMNKKDQVKALQELDAAEKVTGQTTHTLTPQDLVDLEGGKTEVALAKLEAEYPKRLAELQENRSKLFSMSLDTVRNAKGFGSAVTDATKNIGMDMDAVLSHIGTAEDFDRYKTLLVSIMEAKQELSLALQGDGDITAAKAKVAQISELTRQMDAYKENLNNLKFSDSLSAFSNLGSGMDMKTVGSLSAEGVAKVNEIGMAARVVQQQLDNLPRTASKAEIGSLLAKQADLARAAYDLYLQTIHSTPERLAEAFSRMGVDQKLTAILPDSVFQQFMALDTRVQTLQGKLKDPANTSRFKEITAELVTAQKTAEKIKSTLTQGSALETVNKAFGQQLTMSDFMYMSPEDKKRIAESASGVNEFMTDYGNSIMDGKASMETANQVQLNASAANTETINNSSVSIASFADNVGGSFDSLSGKTESLMTAFDAAVIKLNSAPDNAYGSDLPMGTVNPAGNDLPITSKADLVQLVSNAAKSVGMNPTQELFFKGLVNQESRWNPNAMGPETRYGRAYGMFQMLPSTAKLSPQQLMDPKIAAPVAAKHFKHLLDKFGDPRLALAAYNGGEGSKGGAAYLKKRPDLMDNPLPRRTGPGNEKWNSSFAVETAGYVHKITKSTQDGTWRPGAKSNYVAPKAVPTVVKTPSTKTNAKEAAAQLKFEDTQAKTRDERIVFLKSKEDTLIGGTVPKGANFEGTKYTGEVINKSRTDLIGILTATFPHIKGFGETLNGLSHGELAKMVIETSNTRLSLQEMEYGVRDANTEFTDVAGAIKRQRELIDSYTYLTPQTRLSMKAQGINAELPQESIQRMSGTGIVRVNSAVDLVSMYEENLAKAIKDNPNDTANIQQWRGLVDAARENLDSAIAQESRDWRKMTSQAGVDFATSVKGTLNSSIAGVLNGERDEGKGFLGTLATRFADGVKKSVIDTMVNGFTESFTGENSWLMKNLKDLGSHIFSYVGGGLSSLFGLSDNATAPVTGASIGTGSGIIAGTVPNDPLAGQQVNSTLVEQLSVSRQTLAAIQSLNQSTDMSAGAAQDTVGLNQQQVEQNQQASKDSNTQIAGIAGVGMAIGGLMMASENGTTRTIGIIITVASMIATAVAMGGLFKADGGYISGRGTSRSDSIPAWLSNGEYVINAAATSKYLPILQAINNGKGVPALLDGVPAFADGGMVGGGNPAMTSVPMVTAPNVVGNSHSAKSGNQQKVEINITGDISRQTKQEIHRMIPTIASGVNGWNRENTRR